MNSKLKNKIALVLVAFFLLNGCAINKNLTDSKSNISVETHTYFTTENNQKLELDFYKSNQFTTNLPLLIYVHGGGFTGGSRKDDFIKNFCEKMAKKGFSVASISYKLTMKKFGFGCNTEANLKINAFNEASKDISYATSFLIENKNKFGINTNNIILIGSSAGAEAILNLAYVYDNKILPSNFKYAGVIAMAGAITTINFITKNTAIPTLLFHGKKDRLVPFDQAPHHYCKKNSKGYLPLYGSKAIANQLKKVNGSFELHTITDGNHSWNWKPMKYSFKEILHFIDYQVIQSLQIQKEIIKKENDYTSLKI